MFQRRILGADLKIVVKVLDETSGLQADLGDAQIIYIAPGTVSPQIRCAIAIGNAVQAVATGQDISSLPMLVYGGVE